MNLVIVEPEDVARNGDVRFSGVRAAHLLNVLKVTIGQPVRIGLLDGPRGIGTVTAIADGTVTLGCAFDADAPPRPRIDLLLALPRPKVMNRLWAQLAALGVGQIILTNAERVERPYFDTHVLEPDHYRPLLIEGLQQAYDTRMPAVSIHRQLKILVEDHLDTMFEDGTRLMADPSATASMDAVVRARQAERLLLAIGPEGGWNDFERGLLQQHGFAAVGMGSRILRSDTACIALLALAHQAVS